MEFREGALLDECQDCHSLKYQCGKEKALHVWNLKDHCRAPYKFLLHCVIITMNNATFRSKGLFGLWFQWDRSSSSGAAGKACNKALRVHPSDALPQGTTHLLSLPKHCPQLGTKCSNLSWRHSHSNHHTHQIGTPAIFAFSLGWPPFLQNKK